MEGFGVHTSMWTMHWDRAGAEKTIPAAAAYKMDFIEIALLNTAIVDAPHTRSLLEKHNMRAVCSLGLPQQNWAYYANLAFGITTMHDPSATSETVFSQAELQKAGLPADSAPGKDVQIIYLSYPDLNAALLGKNIHPRKSIQSQIKTSFRRIGRAMDKQQNVVFVKLCGGC